MDTMPTGVAPTMDCHEENWFQAFIKFGAMAEYHNSVKKILAEIWIQHNCHNINKEGHTLLQSFKLIERNIRIPNFSMTVFPNLWAVYLYFGYTGMRSCQISTKNLVRKQVAWM